MNPFFDNKNRYQIIYPYTSDKIYVETDINSAARKCYQEINASNLRPFIFIVHDIDTGMIYHFNIPKNKDQQNNNVNLGLNNNPIPNNIIPNNTTPNNIIPNNIIPQAQYQVLQQPAIPPPVIQMVQPSNDNTQILNKYNEVITRLNNVEYQLDTMRKIITAKPKKEDDGDCVIL